MSLLGMKVQSGSISGDAEAAYAGSRRVQPGISDFAWRYENPFGELCQ